MMGLCRCAKTDASHAAVLGLMGSPRRSGNTSRLLKELMAPVVEAGIPSETVVLRDLKYSPCLELTACEKTGECPLKDDMTPLYDKLLCARVVVLASPIFFYGPSAQLKAAIDRCQALWARKYRLNRSPAESGWGIVVAAGGSQGKKLFDGFRLTANIFFDALNLEPAGEVLVRGVDAAGDVDNKPEALAEARALGGKIRDYISDYGDIG